MRYIIAVIFTVDHNTNREATASREASRTSIFEEIAKRDTVLSWSSEEMGFTVGTSTEAIEFRLKHIAAVPSRIGIHLTLCDARLCYTSV